MSMIRLQEIGPTGAPGEWRLISDIYQELKDRLEQSGLVPNKGFRMLQHHKDKRLPEDADFFCVACYDEGGGVRVDVFFDTYEQGTLTSERFAVGRDSGSTTTDLDRMFHIAAELTKAICGDGIAECRPVRERPRVRKIPRPAGGKQ